MGRLLSKDFLMRFSILLGGSIVSFWLLLIIVYSIPIDLIENNVSESLAAIQEETWYPTSYLQGTIIDNFTVAIMLNEAVYDVSNPITDSLLNYYGRTDSQDPIEWLAGLLNGQSHDAISYGRYWNGYLVLLKPLMTLFNIYEIRSLLQTIFILSYLAFAVMSFSKMRRFGIAVVAISAISLAPFGAFDAVEVLPFSFSFIIAMIGMTAMLRSKLDSRTIAIAFFILGAATVYLDFLDNPILTWGMPLIVLLSRSYFEEHDIWTFLRVAGISVLFWIIGYGGIWLSKWILATLVTGTNVIGDAAAAVSFRISSIDSVYYSPLEAIKANMLHLHGYYKIVLLLLAISSILCIVALIANRRKLCFCMVVIIAVSVTPIVWYAVLANHSYIHQGFTYRNLIITFFSLGTAICIFCYSCRKYLQILYEKIATIKQSCK